MNLLIAVDFLPPKVQGVIESLDLDMLDTDLTGAMTVCTVSACIST